MGRTQKEHAERDRKATRQYDAARKRFVEPGDAVAARDGLRRAKTVARGGGKARESASDRRPNASAAAPGARATDDPADETTGPAPDED